MTTINFEVTAELLDKAEQELFQIILQQRQGFNKRWRAGIFYQKGIPFLRAIGMIVSILGALLCTYVLVEAPVWCPDYFVGEFFLLIFVLFFALFYYLPFLSHWLQTHLENIMVKSCHKHAAKCIKGARKEVPFIAEYEIKDNLIVYFRRKNDNSDLVWSRKLNGVAIHGEYATITFKTPQAIQPKVVILHQEFEVFKKYLEKLGVVIQAVGIDN